MKKALFYRKKDSGTVECGLCAHRCSIKDGGRGICGVRENREGVLYSLVYGRLVAEHRDPVEKKPLFHFLPGSRTYSIATQGCNFKCLHCQNYQISHYQDCNQGAITGLNKTPEEVIEAAMVAGCDSLSYTYVEPTIFYEFARECCQLAHQQGLRNIFVSNGYMTPEVARDLAPFLDGINIDIKAYTETFYRKICKARLQPVLDTVELFYQLGVWMEVTTLIIPGLNDGEEELKALADYIYALSPRIPWHVSGFRPTYKMLDRPPTSAQSLRKACQIGKQAGLEFVYQGNIPGEGGEDTVCSQCGRKVLQRQGLALTDNALQDGKCPDCGYEIQGVWGNLLQ